MGLTLIFYAIQIAKSFYDHGRFDVFKKAFPQHILREDSFYELQELALDIVSEFHCFNQKLDYEYDISSYYHYFSSENMTAYIRLCRQYESLLHMKPEENPFWREASTCIKNALWLDSYCYDWALKEKTGKKFSSGIVFAYDDEFCDYVQLIDGLLDIFTFFDKRLCGMEKAVEAAQRNARCTERRAA